VTELRSRGIFSDSFSCAAQGYRKSDVLKRAVEIPLAADKRAMVNKFAILNKEIFQVSKLKTECFFFRPIGIIGL